MKKEKIKALVFIIILISIAFALESSQTDAGCCFNPYVSSRFCEPATSVTSCCPPGTNFYERTGFPYGPDNSNDCATSGVYYENQADSCSDHPKCSPTVCCCNPQFNTTRPLDKPVEPFFCQELGGTPVSPDALGGDCSACGVNPNPTPSNQCDSPNYSPEIEVTLEPVKGEKKFSLSWTDTCSATSYRIIRCDGANCDPVTEINQRNYIDDSEDLFWNKDYTYKIEGIYTVQGDIHNTAEAQGNLGDLECWGRMDGNSFCLQSNYFAKDDYRDHIIANAAHYGVAGINENTFIGRLNAKYGSKLNKAYYCNLVNKIPRQEGGAFSASLTCSDNEVCVVETNTQGYETATCKEKSDCEPDFTDSPFGFYSGKDECFDLGYCYWDTSSTLVDKCYGCNFVEMHCYDYKSEGACSDDHCNIGNCQWNPLSSELGVGVCIATDESNCQWCNKAGSPGTDTTAYNEILASCTEEKADALETTQYPCYYTNGQAKSCDSISCLDFDPSDSQNCPSSSPSLKIDNSLLNQPAEKCSLGVCVNFNGACRKDADGQNGRDCAEGNVSCELDVYKPETTLTDILDDSIVRGFNIIVRDRTSEGTFNNVEGYITKFCIDGPNSSNCLSRAGRQYTIYTRDSKISINGLRVTEWGSDTYLTSLSEGNNTIYFYSIDNSKNLGIVDSVVVEAHANNSRPELYSLEIQGAVEFEGIYYTNHHNPEITASFRSPGAKLQRANLNGATALITSYDIDPAPDFDEEEYTLTDSSLDLAEGRYTLLLDAINENNIPLSSSQREITLVVNYSMSLATITPPPPEFTQNPVVNIRIEFPDKVNLTSVLISGEDFTSEFDTGYKKVFTKTLTLSDGTKRINVTGRTLFGNLATGHSEFVLNNHAPTTESLKIVEPSYGVSASETFTLKLKSENDLLCKYTIDNPVTRDSDFEFMTDFDASNSDYHIKSGVTLNDQNNHKLYVWCKDEHWRAEPFKWIFDLKVDKNKPTISVHTLPESPMAEAPVNATFTVIANEPVKCRYSQTTSNYAEMENSFIDFADDDFQEKKTAYIYLTEEKSYSFKVACEDKAGHISDTVNKDFEIDTSIVLSIRDYTEPYQGNASPVIAISTNKRTTCRWSFVDPQVNIGSDFDISDAYSHVKKLSVNVSSAKYKVYVRCFRGSEYALKTIEFEVDVTAPEMEYVNDTSRIYGKPEFTLYQNKIFVEWYAVDNETGDRGLSYSFSLEEYLTGERVINWTDNYPSKYFDDNKFEGWIDEDQDGEELNLTDDTKYIFKVKPSNIVGHEGLEKSSDGVTTDFSLQGNNTCTNNIEDPDETDIDCGDNCGATCDIGQSCEGNADCDSGYCNSSDKCDTPTCDDNVKNGDETAKDCGGDDCDACANGDSCRDNSDCESSYCKNYVCGTQDECNNHQYDSGEGDTDCGGQCPTKCKSGQFCNTDSDCESGLTCQQAKCKSSSTPEEVDSDDDGMPDSWEIANGLNPNDSTDAEYDEDKDGLTNFEEYMNGTDPNDPDTDGDGFSDGDEVLKYDTDPTDPDSKPSSGGFFKILLIILLILIVLAAIGYLVYTQYFQKKSFKPKDNGRQSLKPMAAMRKGPVQQSMPKRQPFLVRKLKEDKQKKRTSIFESFGSSKSEDKKQESKEEPPNKDVKVSKTDEYIDLSKISSAKSTLKQPKEEIFKRLSSIIDKDKKGKGGKKSSVSANSKKDKDTLKKLSSISEKTALSIKKDLKQHSKKIDSKLSSIEKKVAVVSKPGKVYATKTGKKYHKSECIVLKEISKSKLTKYDSIKDAKKKKLKPCSVCMPQK